MEFGVVDLDACKQGQFLEFGPLERVEGLSMTLVWPLEFTQVRAVAHGAKGWGRAQGGDQRLALFAFETDAVLVTQTTYIKIDVVAHDSSDAVVTTILFELGQHVVHANGTLGGVDVLHRVAMNFGCLWVDTFYPRHKPLSPFEHMTNRIADDPRNFYGPLDGRPERTDPIRLDVDHHKGVGHLHYFFF